MGILEDFGFDEEYWEVLGKNPLTVDREVAAAESMDFFDRAELYVIELEPGRSYDEQDDGDRYDRDTHQLDYHACGGDHDHTTADNERTGTSTRRIGEGLAYRTVEQLEEVNQPGAIIVAGTVGGESRLMDYKTGTTPDIPDSVTIYNEA